LGRRLFHSDNDGSSVHGSTYGSGAELFFQHGTDGIPPEAARLHSPLSQTLAKAEPDAPVLDLPREQVVGAQTLATIA
jgi:hypothetical protein